MKVHSIITATLGALLSIVATLLLMRPMTALGAASLTITPISWGVIGLDSNRVTDGPNIFQVGARVCNTGNATATNVVSTFVWDSTPSPNYMVMLTGTNSIQSVASLTAGSCTLSNFQVALDRNSAVYNKSRAYHISAVATGLGTVSTPTSRELFAEHLLSQSRNHVAMVQGPSLVSVGYTYNFTVTGSTATQGYEQLVFSTIFANNIFHVDAITQTYAAPTTVTNAREYADACGWDPTVTDVADYKSCVGVAPYLPQYPGSTKAGGDPIQAVYRVTIVGAGAANLGAMILDFSGSSFHYNADFGANVLSVTAQVPTLAHITSFTANSDGKGTLLNWQTTYEVNNLGFNLYREEGGKRTRLNPTLVAGSALQASGASPSGQNYSWMDNLPASGKVQYWLEDVDMSGQLTMHGPYTPVTTDMSSATSKQNSPLLSDLGRTATRDTSHQIQRHEAANPKSKIQNPKSFDPSGMNAAKISVDHAGWYRVTQPELVGAGIAAGADPRNLQMYVGGQQVAVRVNGEADGRFDAADSIEFYGTGLNTQATGTQVYWLVAGNSAGLRIASHYSPAKSPDASSFPYMVERRDNTIYFSSLLNGEAENFFGSPVTSQVLGQDLSVNAVDTASQSARTLEVSLQGVTMLDHNVHVAFNGVDVGSVTFTGKEHPVATFPLSLGALHEGTNTVSLVGTAGSYDISLVDHIALTYPHLFQAEGDTLSFTAQGGTQLKVDGFSTAHVRLLDVTDQAQPVELTGLVTSRNGGYSILATAMGKGERKLLAFAGEAAQSPQALVANAPSSWKNFGPGAELLIVTYPAFRASVEPLVALRRSEGLSVAVLDVDDVYDEFSYGMHTPQAIRDLVAWSRSHWTVAPRYLLLVGDSSLDPKNYLGQGNWDLVPTRLVDTENMETASDNWLADADANGLADLAVGRLPVRSIADAERVIGKIVTAGQPRRSLQPNGAVMVADSDPSFESGSETMRDAFPAGVGIETINRSSGNTDEVRARILSAINAGPQVVTFFGHGNVDTWTSDGLLTSDDANTLQNGNRMPVFVMMTCLNGYSQDPTLMSLSESLLLSETGGAQAVWASSGISMPAEQAAMGSAFIQALYGNGKGSLTFGEASMKAKASITDTGLRQTWILFGDPSARLK